MEKIHLKDDVSLIGFKVTTFPNGIGESFDQLMEKFADGMQRSYFGISYCKDDAIEYWAMIEQKQPQEGTPFALSEYTLKKGDYHSVTILNWQSKVDSIKEVFHSMMTELQTPDGTHCIEWYKSDDEMYCMIKQ